MKLKSERNSMEKALILSIYPAPYRVELFEKLKDEYNADVFFESGGGDYRESEWFLSGNYYLLDTKEGKKAFLSAVKNIKKYDFAAFYDFTTKNALRVIPKCIFRRVPYAINCDGVMMSPHGNPIFDLVKKFLVSHARACLASGENAKKYFLKYGAQEKNIYKHTFSTLYQSDILSRPISGSEKLEIRKKLGLPENMFISIAVGRFIPLKRYNYLIKEWKNMPENHLLLLVGSGSEEKTYREIIDTNKIKNVRIEKFHPKNELFDFYKASDVFVHPTSYDVWGLVVNEAFACGLPCIVSDHCVAGLELIEDNKNGFLIPMGNDKLLCERIKKIEDNEAEYDKMSLAALDTIRDYTIENMAKTHIEVFRRLTENVNN